MVLFNKIQCKKMFYNQRETVEIEKLSSLLQEDNFFKIQSRLDGKGMRKGIACLFSGGPGTGKTETAYQIGFETVNHAIDKENGIEYSVNNRRMNKWA
jgi:DNA polymerase III delta prime subunit